MIWEISVLIIGISVLILVAFLVPTIVQLRRSAGELEKVSHHLNQRLPGILANLEDISTNLSAILNAGRQHTDTVGEAVEELKGLVDDVVTFEKALKKQVERPIVQTLDTLVAFNRAVRVFIKVLLAPPQKR
ncbi:MAG: DUF948 domain-containing protein [Calditrichaeota bacterium]|nr:MAG: DUF948 domain-containing protein [Calditrichota bacterium]